MRGGMRGRVLFVLLAAVACGGAANGEAEPLETEGSWVAQEREDTTVAPVEGVATFTPDEALYIAMLLTRTGLEQVRLAETRATTLEVKTYAARMIAHHEATLATLGALAAGRSVAEEKTSQMLLDDAERSLSALESVPAKEIDLPFMTAEMLLHARTLTLLDASLLPSAAVEPPLARALMTMRGGIAEHLVHALRVQGVLRAAARPS